MASYEYKVIAAPRKTKKVKGVKALPERFAHNLAEAINAETFGGWEYLRAETLPIEEKPGFMKSKVEMFQTVLVFRREKDVPARAQAQTQTAAPAPAEPAPTPAPAIEAREAAPLALDPEPQDEGPRLGPVSRD
ncbi:DUF4177 domain-containing protein [Oceanomicrobium pacificus]|uniref:DUF4177 domain-containing protein n=1 Tax=Oceanomicrobium pacificus TaxID=2692916 RepID=A0A6B0TV21_9RHOB|nr:DUF4177 domain-containing protein [Oceanomicrobium pacificus]MXU65448.1 DUF4177 domain-containing protein [Oceanomicrobium pacificus]